MCMHWGCNEFTDSMGLKTTIGEIKKIQKLTIYKIHKWESEQPEESAALGTVRFISVIPRGWLSPLAHAAQVLHSEEGT